MILVLVSSTYYFFQWMIIIIIIKITEFGNSTDFDEAAYQGLYCLPSSFSILNIVIA